MSTLIVSSFVLALAFCAPPGIITAESIRRGFARGFSSALQIQFGSLVGDAAWAVIALTGSAFLIQNTFVHLTLGLLGALLLLYLAWNAFRDARHGIIPQSKNGLGQNDFVTGILLSLGNPFGIALWLSIGTTAVASRVAHPQPIHFVVFFASFMSGMLLWCFFMAGLIAWGKQFITVAFFRRVNIICGLFLVYFGIQLGWNTLLVLKG